MDWLGIHWVGISGENGRKVVLTVALIVLAYALSRGGRSLIRRLTDPDAPAGARFWSRQLLALAVAVLALGGLFSIWFDNPARLTTAMGLATAGVAFALQKVITAFAGYIVILHGHTFRVGDRITMGGVRGDVVALGFMQTTIMEMGEPPGTQGAEPAMWVRSRQFTGRIVTVANSRIFDEPVYNYTRDFPYIWDEVCVPVPYRADRGKAEEILISAARRHAVRRDEVSGDTERRMRERFSVQVDDIEPRVFLRLTDNWLEMNLRFLVHAHGAREVKDAMTREIVDALKDTGIGVASSTYDVVGLPPIRVAMDGSGNASLHDDEPSRARSHESGPPAH